MLSRLLLVCLVGVLGCGSIAGIEGAGNGGVPPDPTLAVGPNHLVEATNGFLQVWDRGGHVVSTKSLLFFLSPCPYRSDPRIYWDSSSQRWMLVTIGRTGTPSTLGSWCFAMSQTADPTGLWTISEFQVVPGVGAYPDLPFIASSDDKVVVTGIIAGTAELVLNKADLLAGVAPRMSYYGPPASPTFYTPAHSLESGDSNIYVAGVTSDVSHIVFQTITGTPGVGAGVKRSTVSLPLTVYLYDPPVSVPQKGSGLRLDLQGSDFVSAVRRGGSIWFANTVACTPPGDLYQRACAHALQVRVSPTAPAAVDNEVTSASSGTHSFFPAVTTDFNNDLLLTFGTSSASTFPSLYATGRKTADAPNTLRPVGLVASGAAAYTHDPDVNGTTIRWGDLFGAAADPVQHSLVFGVGEYPGPTDYKTVIFGVDTTQY